MKEGDRLRVALENRLPDATMIHWHGVPVPNAMDGVPNLMQVPIAPGATFLYDFVAVTATARKLAILFYRALRFGLAYADPGASHYEARYRQRVIHNLQRRAREFGFRVWSRTLEERCYRGPGHRRLTVRAGEPVIFAVVLWSLAVLLAVLGLYSAWALLGGKM